MKIIDLIKYINDEIGLKQQEKWDNSGLQCGSIYNDIKGIVITMDITEENIEFCKKTGSNLIISHHPLIFTTVNSIDFDTYTGKIIRQLIINDITVLSFHTSLDMADYGVSYYLAKAMNLNKIDFLTPPDMNPRADYGYGFIADIEPTELEAYAKVVKKNLKCKEVKLFAENNSIIIKRVAFCGGAGNDFIDAGIDKHVDLYITGDIGYHDAQLAVNNNMAVLDAGHYNTEAVILDGLKEFIAKKVTNVNICDKNYVNFVII